MRIFIGSELWLGSHDCISNVIPQNPIKFHYHLCLFAGCCEGDGVNMKIRHCSNCGVVYSGPVCHRSAERNNNKMEVKQCRKGRGGKRAGLVTEGMMY